MEINGVLALANKIATNDIDLNDKRVKDAETIIANLMKTESGREELAEIIAISLEDVYNKFDITPMLFETKHFRYGQKPVFKTHKKGIVAYWTAPNSYVPKSRNYSTEITMDFEGLGVRPEALLSELKTGRLDSLASLIKDGREAIEVELLRKSYEVIAQAYNATANSSNYLGTNAITNVALDQGIAKIRKKMGGNPVLIGSYDLCVQIEKLDGYANNEQVQNEIRNKGFLGKYRGCPIVYLPEILDQITGKSMIPTDKLFIVGNKIGVSATYGDVDFMQEQNMDDKSWNCRIDKEIGFAVTRPEGLFVIEITD